jgi:hypothetical protein
MSFTSLVNPLNRDLFICTPFTQCWDEEFKSAIPPFRPEFNWIDNLSNLIHDNLGNQIIFAR